MKQPDDAGKRLLALALIDCVVAKHLIELRRGQNVPRDCSDHGGDGGLHFKPLQQCVENRPFPANEQKAERTG